MIEASALSARYGRIVALHAVDFTIGEGEIVAVIGANGAGKTSLLRALSGTVAMAGRLTMRGKTISRLAADRRVAAGIAQVPEGRQLFGNMSVRDNLLLGGYRRGGGVERLNGILRRFPILEEKLNKRASSLSGGQQQQLAMGRALMSAPDVLLLDEPSMGLAPNIIADVFRLIVDLRQAGMTILLVEQNARAALRIADRAYVLENGRVVLGGSASSVAASDDVRRAYLGH